MSPLHDAPSDSPVVVLAENVSKHFVLRKDNSLKDRLLAFKTGRRNREDFTALSDVSIEVKAGHTVALIGHNGSGKSTLLKVIGGILDPTSGSISRRGKVAALLELGAGFHPDLSGRENVYLNASLLGMSRAETEAVFDDIVNFAEIEEFIDTQVKFYSSGMYVRLAFAVAIHTDPDILLVDEVLAVGDEAFQRKCMDTIRRFQAEGRTILLVTHNLNQVIELADQAVLLHHGHLVFSGDPRDAVTKFRELLEERQQELGAARGETGSKLMPLRISAECYPAGQVIGDRLSLGQNLVIDITIEGSIPDENWLLYIQIDNVHGTGVFGTDNHLRKVDLAPLEGKAQFRFTFANTSFSEGKYFVNVTVSNSAGQQLRNAQPAASFDAVAPTTSHGVVYMPYEVERFDD